MKELLKQLWKAELDAGDAPAKNTACRFQTMVIDSIVETWVCPRAVYWDYAPKERLEQDKLLPMGDYPMSKLADPQRVYQENMCYMGAIPLSDSQYLGCMFLNDGLEKDSLSVYDLNGQTGYWRCALPWGDETSFQWVRKVLYYIPDPVKDLVWDTVTLREVNARLVRLKAVPDIAIMFSSSTSNLLVTMASLQPHDLVYEQLFIHEVQHRLDGYDSETKAFSRLIEVRDKTMPMRGLANPTKAAAAAKAEATALAEQYERQQEIDKQSAAAKQAEQEVVQQQQPEPQVEDVQPEQAEVIAQQAPEAPVAAEQPEEEETKKRTRVRKAPTAATPANAKALEDTIAYLGSPVADSMTMEEIDEEIRKCRDLGIVLSRRMANLYTAGMQIPKKKLAAVSAILN